MTEPEDMIGKEGYDVTVWAQRIRLAQRAIPGFLAVIGVDAVKLANNVARSAPMLAGAIAGGLYPSQSPKLLAIPETTSTFTSWEMMAAGAIYWYLVPACQFALAIFFVDTWQYFLHRAMHMNQWLYSTLANSSALYVVTNAVIETFHSRHHRLYVPYAFGALYNHPFEGFLLDTLGAALAFKVAGMTTRQGMWFFTCSTIKTVDDHCGYALPWDPLQHLTSNNAGYHDVHHQSWGIKVCILSVTIPTGELNCDLDELCAALLHILGPDAGHCLDRRRCITSLRTSQTSSPASSEWRRFQVHHYPL
jgi:sphinganine C4-monooxygenase